MSQIPNKLSESPELPTHLATDFDVLSQVLDSIRLQAALTFSADFSAPWGFAKDRQNGVPFHIVLEGQAWLFASSENPRQLSAGDIALLPTGVAHSVASERTAERVPFAALMKATRKDESTVVPRSGNGSLCLVLQNGGPPTRLMSGIFTLDSAFPSPLLTGLPPALVVANTNGAVPKSIDVALAALLDTSAQPGAQAVARRFGELLFVQMLQAYILNADPTETGWLLGLRHPYVGRALSLIHAAPGEPWTISLLAKKLGTSRSRLTFEFSRTVGKSIGRYLLDWRMRTAAHLLTSPEKPKLSALAPMVGYQSDIAFAKAFKRWSGSTPGAYRTMSIL